jgi:hypothetical protein
MAVIAVAIIVIETIIMIGIVLDTIAIGIT